MKMVTFMQGRVNGQYILEGLAFGLITMAGGCGFIILDIAFQGNLAIFFLPKNGVFRQIFPRAFILR